MRTTVRKWNDGVQLYHESYDNYIEFYQTLLERQKTNGRGKTFERMLDEGGHRWVGVDSVDEAKKYLLEGWEAPLGKLKEGFEREVKALGLRDKHKPFANVCGYMPIIPNALMRLPKAMIDSEVVKVKSKVLRFLISISRSSGLSADEIVDKMAKKLAVISNLEMNGYRCRIEVCWQAFGGLNENGEKYSASCGVLIKSEDQPFDIKRICYPIANASMSRLFMFCWAENLPLEKNDYYIWGYGRAFHRWEERDKKAYAEALKQNNESVICVDLDTDIEDMLKKGGVR